MRSVRSVIAAMLALAGLALVPSWAASFGDPDTPGGEAEEVAGRSVTIALLPYGTTVEEIAAVPGLAPGILSAGLGSVPLAQTYLDVSQGNRTNESLYEIELPLLYVRDGRIGEPVWDRTVRRAESAPANIVPGLLASTLAEAGVPVVAEADSGLATLIAVDRGGVARIAPRAQCATGCGPGLGVIRVRLGELPALAADLAGDDLLIAIAAGQELLPTGIAGDGFETGNLTSDSTRSEGIVTATDIAPTVLDRFGVAIPDEVNGTRITVAGERDPESISDLKAQLEDRPNRDFVMLWPIAGWLVLVGLATAIWRGRAARVGLRLVGLSCAWAPLLLLVSAALDAGEPAAVLVNAIGAPALAVATDRLLPAYRGLALACGATVAAHAVAVVTGSSLTSVSVLGPNPEAGIRFFGIGNELEAILCTFTLVGAGAWLSTRRGLSRRAGAAWFVVIALAVTAAFAPGRFGADVGSAIVLGVGAATAAVLALGLARRRAILVVAGGGAAALAALVAVDLVVGGAHLSRSVLGAGGTGDLIDVLDRRLTLTLSTFTDPRYPELFAAALVGLAVGFARRRVVLGWFGDAWAARSGFCGALAGILVGTIANDSGTTLLVIGMIALAIFAGFFWASREPAGRREPPAILG